jgi:hypothetical protein
MRAIEDCRHVSARLERALIAAGERAIRVAPALTETSRRAAREPGKSDPIDATAIARAALREGVERFPAAVLDERAMEIRMLTDYRDQLVAEITRWINRLRWHLVTLAPELEVALPPSALDGPQTRAKLARQLARLEPSTRLRLAKTILKRIGELYRRARALPRAPRTDQRACTAAARRTRVRTDHRPYRRRRALPQRRLLRPPRRDRPDPRQLRQHHPPSPAPRRGPATQPSDPHHRALPRTHRPHHPRLPRTQTRRRQDQTRSHPLPQTPPRSPHLAAALHDPTLSPGPIDQTSHHHRRHSPSSHAMRPLNPANSDNHLT